MNLWLTMRRGLLASQWRVVAALLLVLVALWVPEVNLPRRTFDYIVTFDITQSMNVDDVSLDGAPVRRLALARAGVRDTLRHLPCGSKMGFSIFAGYRSFVLLMPIEVCSNYDVLLSALEKIDDHMRWANASNISKGVYWSLRNAKGLENTRIAFITDGQEAPPVTADQTAALENTDDAVRGWLIGVGGDVPMRIPKTDSEGTVTGYWSSAEVTQIPDAPGESHEHLSSLRERYLTSLADQNHLGYSRLDTPGSLTRALLDGGMAHRAPQLTNVRWIAAALALLLLSWHFLPEFHRRRRGAPGRRPSFGE